MPTRMAPVRTTAAKTTGWWMQYLRMDEKLKMPSDDEDETAELQRELEKIKRERAEKREQEVRHQQKTSYCGRGLASS